jgi:hypothetical protein
MCSGTKGNKIMAKLKRKATRPLYPPNIVRNALKPILLGSIVLTIVSMLLCSTEGAYPKIYPYRTYGWPLPVIPFIPYIGTDINQLFNGNMFYGFVFLFALIPDLLFWGMVSFLPLTLWRWLLPRRNNWLNP